MNEQGHGVPRLSFLEAAGLIILFLTVGVWGAAVTAMALMAAAQYLGGAIGMYLLEAGPDRVMRRCLMGWAALFIVILLKRSGWRGWRDCGFSADKPGVSTRPWWELLLIGISVGLITLGSLSVLTLLLGVRIVTPMADGSEALRRAVSFIGSGITVALIEETVCRGMLFRILARSWRVWPAALLTSALFALAHFLSPDPQSFHGASFFQASINVYLSTYTATGLTAVNLLTFINLSLLGIVFCRFVVRTQTLWLSIGAHAAWVWIVKFFNLWTTVTPKFQPTLWLGQRSDFMDSIMVTVIMAGLIALAFRRAPRADRILYQQGVRWHVAAEAQEQVLKWLIRYFESGVLKTGAILKDDDGGRVAAQSGLVLKSYWPKRGWLGIHFAIRPPRARRAFLLGRELIALGIATPEPLAWAVRRRYGFLQAEWIVITEAIGSERVTDWLKRNIREPGLRARVMASYGRLAAAFHRNGYSNRDLKPENVMGSIREPWRLQVIDLDGARHLGWITRRRAGRDLMRVGASLASLGWSGEADVRAFFDAYNAELSPRLRRYAFPQ